MKLSHLNLMTKGWFVGSFDPTLLKTDQFEVAVKEYKAGDTEDWHIHKIATEITVILNGKAQMAEKVFSHGDIIMLEPNEGTSFKALTDLTTVVVKTPSVAGDKYFSEQI